MQIHAGLDELNASIDRQDADGDLLEQLVEDAATSIPSWELRRCWRFAAWPGRADFDLPSHDDGIDLVAEKTDGDLVAIQCKARSSGSVTPTHIQKFAGKANPRIFQERWLVTTTELTSGNERALGECDVIWKNALIELRQIADERPTTEEPDPRTAMQDEAVRDCIAVLRQPPSELAELWREQGAALGYLPANVGRAKLVLPCGTGKTRVSMRIVNELCADGTLAVVLVPSIALIGQVRRAYLEGLRVAGRATTTIAVCSDKTDDRCQPGPGGAHAAVFAGAELFVQPGGPAGRDVFDASGADPDDLHDDAVDVRQCARAVQLEQQLVEYQRAAAVGVHAGERAVHRLQRGPRHRPPDARPVLRASQPCRRRQGESAVSVLTLSPCDSHAVTTRLGPYPIVALQRVDLPVTVSPAAPTGV